MMQNETIDVLQEFDRQVEILFQKNYPKESQLTKENLVKLLAPLSNALKQVALSSMNIEEGQLPFVIVVSHTIMPVDFMMSQVGLYGKKGIVKLFPLEPHDFQPIPSVSIPQSPVYLLIDIDRGKKTLNIRPQDALINIQQKNRSPLTIDEGIAILTQYPEFLKKNNCFSLLASRHAGDKRVPAIWINAKKEPNLGWCWDGNPHTWLGSASCSTRISNP
jgi:hypothetical protein